MAIALREQLVEGAEQGSIKTFCESRDCTMIRNVGYRGGNDGTQTDVAIGAQNGGNAFRGYDRNVSKELICGGGTVLEHLDRP